MSGGAGALNGFPTTPIRPGSGTVVTLAGDVNGPSNANVIAEIQGNPVNLGILGIGDAGKLIGWDGAQIVATQSSQTMDVTFDVAPGPGDVGKGYYRKADNTVSLARGDSDVTVGQGLAGIYQGNANELAVGERAEMDVYLQADLDGLTGPVPAPIPVPGQPFFLSTTVAGAFTTQDPTDLAAVGSYSVAAGILSDVTGYNSATGGVVRGQFAPQPPVGPLGTGSSPPTDPPYYVDPHIFDCPMATSPGDLVALDGTDDAVVLADRALGKPAFAFVYDKPTATTCRVYNGVSIIFGGYGGIVNGGTYWLGTAGQLDASPPADGSGEIIQQVAVGINAAGNIRPAIDINGWDPNTP